MNWHFYQPAPTTVDSPNTEIYEISNKNELKDEIKTLRKSKFNSNLEKNKRIWSCITSFSASISISCIAICIISQTRLLEDLLDFLVFNSFVIQKSSPSYKFWKNPPIEPHLSVWIFNLTNVEDFLSGKAKPIVKEVGPYIYLQKLSHENISFRPPANVAFSIMKQYTFSPNLSFPLHETDFIMMPNIPLLGALKSMKAASPLVKRIFQTFLSSFEDLDSNINQPFIKTTIAKFLWGYPTALMTIADIEKRNCDSSNYDENDFFSDDSKMFEDDICELDPANLSLFGLFRSRNNTLHDFREINSGAFDINKKGKMISWNGFHKFPTYWNSEKCNIVEGYDPGSLPILLEPHKNIEIFIGNICRKITFQYMPQATNSLFDYPTYQYSPKPDTFDSAEKNPENKCFCISDICLPSGIHDMSTCQLGSPIYISWPHFLHGDPSLISNVDGLSPDPDKHAFIINAVPKYGISVRALGRFQMNVMIENNGFKTFENITTAPLVLPFVWFEEGIHRPSKELNEQLLMLMTLSQDIRKKSTALFLGLSIVFLLPKLVFCLIWFR